MPSPDNKTQPEKSSFDLRFTIVTWALKLRSPDPEMRAGGFEASVPGTESAYVWGFVCIMIDLYERPDSLKVRTLSKNIELMGIDSGD